VRRCTIVARLIAAGAAAGVVSGLGPTGQAASTPVWAGTWEVVIGPTLGAGTMTLTQSGSQVNGQYLGGTGSLLGTAQGSTLTGTWRGVGGHGEVVLTLSPGDGSFTGLWKPAAAPRFPGGSTWNGTCQSGACAAAATVPAQQPAVLPLPSRLLIGGVDDAAEWDSPVASMELAQNAGFGAIVLSSVWTPPLTAPGQAETERLGKAVAAAEELGIEPIVAVYSFAADTPLTERARGQFASYAAAIARALPDLRYMSIGNEPNSGVFWLPQFGPDGSDVASPAYYLLLSETYDLLARTAPGLTVIGGSLASRGRDRPGGGVPSQSPTRFIRDLGAAYRASGRAQPPMDMFSLHPYPANSSIPPSVSHPDSTTIGIADYGKLVALLTAAFGAPLPIDYGEYGINTFIPPGDRHLYTGRRAKGLDPVSAATQAADYVEAIRLAACQPLVRMLLFFHVADETSLTGLQSGLYYANGAPKPSLSTVAAVARAAASRGVSCPNRGGLSAQRSRG
jgi:hypothetical protein